MLSTTLFLRRSAPHPPPDKPDFCPPDEGEVRDYFIRKSGTEAQADRFRAFYTIRPPEQAKDFLKDAALRRQAMRKGRKAVTQ